MEELTQITLGFLYEIMTEKDNDSYDYPYEATQDDINSFW